MPHPGGQGTRQPPVTLNHFTMPTLQIPQFRAFPLLQRLLALLVVAGGFAAAAGPAAAQSGLATSAESVSVRVVPALRRAAPGDSFPVAVVMDIKKGWHIWTSAAQVKTLPAGMSSFDGAVNTEISVDVSPAAAATAAVANIQWPEIHGVQANFGDGPTTYPVYERRAVAMVPVVLDPAAVGTVTFKVMVRLQACDSTNCQMPAEIEASVVVEVAAGAKESVGPEDAPLFAGFDQTVFGRIKENPSMGAGLSGKAAKPIEFALFGFDFTLDPQSGGFFPVLLALAFIGGVILNFTPCVLPVIPLKIIGLAAAAAGDRKRTFLLGCAMTAGVVGFWLALGVLLSSVKGFEQSNQLFQYPAFTIFVGIFIGVMAVGMAGFFSVGLPQWVYAIEPKHESYLGSVLFGIMTAVLSTPCTAPLMGAAAGWAVTTKSAGTITTVFLAIGFGMGSPYMVLSAFPQLARKMPKSGPASDLLKQVMGLLLLAAAIYFVGAGINGLLEEPSRIYWWIVGTTGFAAGAWLVFRTIRIAKGPGARAIFVVVGLFIALVSAAIPPIMTYERLPWSKYTPAVFENALKEGNVVVVDFTAEWCLNCKTLEKTVLESGEVAPVLKERGVKLLKIDITGNNEDGAKKLAESGRVTIPLLIVYAPNGRQVFLSDAYTKQQIVDAVMDAQGRAKN